VTVHVRRTFVSKFGTCTDGDRDFIIALRTLENTRSTAVVAADDDYVITPYPGHLLLVSLGSCSPTKLVLQLL